MIDLYFQALWILAFFRRRNAIGGALLVFFVQVFAKLALSLILVVSVLVAWQIRDRNVRLPFQEWEVQVSFLILAMNFAATAFTAIAALALLKSCSWRYVAYVRSGLCALAVLAIINLLYHRVNIASCLELIFPLIFLPYFLLSKRVQRAFHRVLQNGPAN